MYFIAVIVQYILFPFTFSAIPRLKCLIAIIGDGPNSTFSRICTETREYVMSMTAVITYIKVAIVRTMSSNKVKFHKLMFLFQIKFHSWKSWKFEDAKNSIYSKKIIYM